MRAASIFDGQLSMQLKMRTEKNANSFHRSKIAYGFRTMFRLHERRKEQKKKNDEHSLGLQNAAE